MTWREEAEQFVDLVVGGRGVAEGLVRPEGVVRAAATAGTNQVSLGLEVAQDRQRGAFGDADPRRNLRNPGVGVGGDG
ncbi:MULTISPECIES: hypothetical protein [Blastococcus]|uniref:hypothetical protein n=1 Tax=Blastococcus TaxID=38501 RepID=UPI0013142A69|nr:MULTISPECIES: hypothetical protein [Blastococcus]MCA0145891.1 hypothetical protein [Blastococcus sp. LR1]